jgi:uncharacterized membrane-anchored protein
MLCSSERGITQRTKQVLVGLVLSVSAGQLGLVANADPLVPSVPQPAEWISGPASAKLGRIASIRIPQGFKFADAPGARAILERATSSVPKGLVGILSPESEGWWVVLKFTDLGYVKDDDKARMDPAAILKSVWNGIERQNVELTKQGLAPTSSVDWELKPLYDANDHTLEWAIRSQSQPQSQVKHTVCLLGRHGTLEAVTVRPYRGFSDLTPLKQLVKGLVFNAEERYADYQSNDKISASGLVALITAPTAVRETVEASGSAEAGLSSRANGPWFWVGVGMFACGGVGVGMLLLRKPRRRESSGGRRRESEPEVAVSPVSGNGSGHVAPAPAAAPSPVGLRVKTEPVRKAVNGKHRGDRRKKVFDYNRYFSDLNSAVSSHLNQFEAAGANGYPSEANRLSASPASNEVSTPTQEELPGMNAEVIAHQKSIIEEQKRLIQEQTRLIEEKSRLIAEKNQLLKMQAEFIENKLL